MSEFFSIEVLVENINKLTVKLKEKSLNSDELELLVFSSQSLYERALILRHKAYEEKVFGVNKIDAVIEQEEKGIVNIDTDEPESMFVENSPKINLELDEDQSIFDFDLFSEPTLEKDSLENEDNDEEMSFDSNNVGDSESVTSEYFEEDVQSEIIIIEEQIDSEFIVDENEIYEEKTSEGVDFFQKVQSDKISNTDMYLPKLETLVGAFSIADKLYIIQQLFDGSSDEFNNAIHLLDIQDDYSSAKRLISRLAYEYSWNPDSTATIDFIKTIERRYKL